MKHIGQFLCAQQRPVVLVEIMRDIDGQGSSCGLEGVYDRAIAATDRIDRADSLVARQRSPNLRAGRPVLAETFAD